MLDIRVTLEKYATHPTVASNPNDVRIWLQTAREQDEHLYDFLCSYYNLLRWDNWLDTPLCSVPNAADIISDCNYRWGIYDIDVAAIRERYADNTFVAKHPYSKQVWLQAIKEQHPARLSRMQSMCQPLYDYNNYLASYAHMSRDTDVSARYIASTISLVLRKLRKSRADGLIDVLPWRTRQCLCRAKLRTSDEIVTALRTGVTIGNLGAIAYNELREIVAEYYNIPIEDFPLYSINFKPCYK